MKGAIAKATRCGIRQEYSSLTSSAIREPPGTPPRYGKGNHQADGMKKVDAFVAGVGTGGTITALVKHSEKNTRTSPSLLLSPRFSGAFGRQPGPIPSRYRRGFIPSILNTRCMTGSFKVTDDAADMARRLAHEEGILAASRPVRRVGPRFRSRLARKGSRLLQSCLMSGTISDMGIFERR